MITYPKVVKDNHDFMGDEKYDALKQLYGRVRNVSIDYLFFFFYLSDMYIFYKTLVGN